MKGKKRKFHKINFQTTFSTFAMKWTAKRMEELNQKKGAGGQQEGGPEQGNKKRERV